MVNIDTLAITILAINAFLFYLVGKMSKMGDIRSGAISGWISSFFGFYVLLNKGVIPELTDRTTFVFAYAVIVVFAILLVFVGKDKPSNYNIPILGELVYYVPRIGIFMGIVTAAITQILA